jgi:branched-subunit amino acid aminotransferase/4-amino-4-deoxychorismate lyase
LKLSLWINGRIVAADRATVPALDPAVQIGSGLFEVMRAYEGEPFLLDRHLARLRRSARTFGFRVRPTNTAIGRGVRGVLRANKLREAYVRLVLTEGGSFMIRASPLPPVPAVWYRKGAAVEFAPWRRDPRAPLYGHKTLNYLENVLTLARAREKNLADYLFQSIGGPVLEGCVTNVFLVSRGRLQTPALEGILPGVTRGVVIGIAKALKIPVHERSLMPRDFERADEVFLTNALIEVLPISRVGKWSIGPPGPVTSALSRDYRLLPI